MTSSASYPARVTTQPGSPRAKAVVAAAVIAVATALAGATLLAGFATGSAIEAPAQPGVRVTQPAETTTPLTSAAPYQ
jgi:hypothetical protein